MSITLAADSEAERHFRPEAEELRNKLLLADRGYPAVSFFEALVAHGAFFIMRLSRSFDPWVRVAYLAGKLLPLRKPTRLSQLVSQQHGACLDLDVEFQPGNGAQRSRLIVVPGKERAMTRLCTSLERGTYPFELVGKL